MLAFYLRINKISVILLLRYLKACVYLVLYNNLVLLFEAHFTVKKVGEFSRIVLWKANKLRLFEAQ